MIPNLVCVLAKKTIFFRLLTLNPLYIFFCTLCIFCNSVLSPMEPTPRFSRILSQYFYFLLFSCCLGFIYLSSTSCFGCLFPCLPSSKTGSDSTEVTSYTKSHRALIVEEVECSGSHGPVLRMRSNFRSKPVRHRCGGWNRQWHLDCDSRWWHFQPTLQTAWSFTVEKLVMKTTKIKFDRQV